MVALLCHKDGTVEKVDLPMDHWQRPVIYSQVQVDPPPPGQKLGIVGTIVGTVVSTQQFHYHYSISGGPVGCEDVMVFREE